MMDPEAGQWFYLAHCVSCREAMQATYYGGHIGDGQALSGVKFLATMISMDEVFSEKTGVFKFDKSRTACWSCNNLFSETYFDLTRSCRSHSCLWFVWFLLFRVTYTHRTTIIIWERIQILEKPLHAILRVNICYIVFIVLHYVCDIYMLILIKVTKRPASLSGVLFVYWLFAQRPQSIRGI